MDKGCINIIKGKGWIKGAMLSWRFIAVWLTQLRRPRVVAYKTRLVERSSNKYRYSMTFARYLDTFLPSSHLVTSLAKLACLWSMFVKTLAK